MKKRVLFVDDESLVLDGLRRSLRPMGAEWDMAFVESGEKALDIMCHLPFDVVIADTWALSGLSIESMFGEQQRGPPVPKTIIHHVGS